STNLHLGYLAAAIGIIGALAMLNHARIYRVTPYLLLGVILWFCIHGSGIHATLAGVLLALFIPTRPPPNYRGLVAQADAILTTQGNHSGEVLRYGPSQPASRALDAVHDRLESPAARVLRRLGPQS